MKNKKSIIKIVGLLSLCIGCFGLSLTSAITYDIHLGKVMEAASKNNIKEKILMIHFDDYKNDFGWFFYFSDFGGRSEEVPVEGDMENAYQYNVSAGNSGFVCRQEIQWFYYNAERWERLRPLNSWYWSDIMTWLVTTWWLYTDCLTTGYIDDYMKCNDEPNKEACHQTVSEIYPSDWNGYYWSIEQSYSWQYMNLIAWVQYKKWNIFTEISWNSILSPTFIRFNNRIPLWFIYDYNWWVGLVWCRISNTNVNPDAKENEIRELIKIAQNKNKGFKTMFIIDEESDEIIYTWKYSDLPIKQVTRVNCSWVSMEDSLLNIVVEWIMWMSAIQWDNPIVWAIGNWSDKKMQGFSTKSVNNSTVLNYANKKAETLCRWKWRKEEPNDPFISKEKIICIENSSSNIVWDRYKNKTLIVKNGDVEIPTNSTGYDIFIGDWNLIIKENGEDAEHVFDVHWRLISDKTKEEFNNVVSGAINGPDNCYKGDLSSVGSFIGWNFIVNWHVKWDGDWKLYNKYFVYWKFVTTDTIDDIDGRDGTFKWKCREWITTENDRNYCPQGGVYCGGSKRYNPYRNASLVIIDQNHDSPLLK